MPKTRITVGEAQRFTSKLVAATFEAREAELRRAEGVLFWAVYNDLYDEEDRKVIASLSKRWLPSSNDILVKVGESVRRIGHANGVASPLFASEDVNRVVEIKTPSVARAVTAWRAESEKLLKERRQFHREVETTIRSFRNWEDLIRSDPRFAEYVAKWGPGTVLPETAAQPPAIIDKMQELRGPEKPVYA
jgi:hypothetical protein